MNKTQEADIKTSPIEQALFPEDAHYQYWSLLKVELGNLLPNNLYKLWISHTQCLIDNPSKITLLVPKRKQSLPEEVIKQLREAQKNLALEHVSINLSIGRDQAIPLKYLGEDGLLEEQKPEPEETKPENILTNCQPDSEDKDLKSSLNQAYTFNSFVRGPSNEFALASCLNVAENPGSSYNPLFLYGSTGLGKTHLLHSVGNAVKKSFPEYIVTYISSERFMNEMIHCIRHNKMLEFREKYRRCDLFLMDDIQFISGNKAATQEEFFHTFNSLYEAKKQIIITSDLYPQDIADIEARLRNRFQWGLIADIQPPDVEHRIAILINKAELLNVDLAPEVAEYIAKQAKRNVRELEGALHRIAAFAALQGRPLDKAIAMETFRSIVNAPPQQLGTENIQKAVAQYFKIKLQDLKSQKRQRTLTQPRQIAMYLVRKHTGASYPDIAKKFGGKNHTTIMHGVKKIQNEKNTNLDLKAQLEALERALEKLQD